MATICDRMIANLFTLLFCKITNRHTHQNKVYQNTAVSNLLEITKNKEQHVLKRPTCGETAATPTVAVAVVVAAPVLQSASCFGGGGGTVVTASLAALVWTVSDPDSYFSQNLGVL